MRVLLVDALPERAAAVEETLRSVGHEVIVRLDPQTDLREEVALVTPDLVIIDVDSPNRDMLEGMYALNRDRPRPVVIFTEDDNPDLIRAAVAAGVSAYVVGDVQPGRVLPVLTVAITLFEQFQSIRRELDDARCALADRKLIERAKGILMKQKQMDEAAAYSAMRSMAMDRNLKLSELARSLIAAAELLA